MFTPGGKPFTLRQSQRIKAQFDSSPFGKHEAVGEVLEWTPTTVTLRVEGRAETYKLDKLISITPAGLKKRA